MIRLRDCVFTRPEGFHLSIDRLDVDAGEQIALIGPSGSGKTTLLHLLAGILQARSGSIRIGSGDQAVDMTQLGEQARCSFRLRHIGMVFQDFALLAHLTARDNVLLPLRLGAARVLPAARKRAEDLLGAVGLAEQTERKPDRLSHGERQRLALCRALLMAPPLLLADEPTGNLDADHVTRSLDLLQARSREQGATLLMVTHDRTLVDRFDRLVDMRQLAGETLHG